MEPILDPRAGDLEDDASSPKSQSMLAFAGALLSEISLPRLAMSWVSLLAVPALLLGAAPIAASVWLSTLTARSAYVLVSLGSAGLIAALAVIGWFGSRPLFRAAESSFWSLHSLLVQPIYAGFRETLRHLAEFALMKDASIVSRSRLRAATALFSGVIVSALAGVVIWLLWPFTHMLGGFPPSNSIAGLTITILANSVALVAAYLAVAAIVWAIADATMPQPSDLPGFAPRPASGKTWRVAHLSDIHIVGEPYGFRIESGRSGPQGNGQWKRTLETLSALHAENPIDIVLITGDMTDAGRSAEWAEFQSTLSAYREIAERALILPGNHDVNIVDRANPARLDLPHSPNRRLRLIRAISAMAALQGERLRIVEGGAIGETLAQALTPYVKEMRRFASTGRPLFSPTVTDLWNRIFPMVLSPGAESGLGVMLLNSNAASHFSFTNALGLVSAEQAKRAETVLQSYPGAVWIIALHHHLVEYPRAAKALSERIGTALINGNWFVRKLRRHADRLVVMHGHRHIDWIGACANLTIVSAPSPVMEAVDGKATYFYVHTLAIADDRRLRLLAPERVTAPSRGEPAWAHSSRLAVAEGVTAGPGAG